MKFHRTASKGLGTSCFSVVADDGTRLGKVEMRGSRWFAYGMKTATRYSIQSLTPGGVATRKIAGNCCAVVARQRAANKGS